MASEEFSQRRNQQTFAKAARAGEEPGRRAVVSTPLGELIDQLGFIYVHKAPFAELTKVLNTNG